MLFRKATRQYTKPYQSLQYFPSRFSLLTTLADITFGIILRFLWYYVMDNLVSNPTDLPKSSRSPMLSPDNELISSYLATRSPIFHECMRLREEVSQL